MNSLKREFAYITLTPEQDEFMANEYLKQYLFHKRDIYKKDINWIKNYELKVTEKGLTFLLTLLPDDDKVLRPTFQEAGRNIFRW